VIFVMDKIEIEKCHGGYSVEVFNEAPYIFVELSDAFDFMKEYFSDVKNRVKKACVESVNC